VPSDPDQAISISFHERKSDMNDYERTQIDTEGEKRHQAQRMQTGPDEVEIYDGPENRATDGSGTGMGMWGGLLILIIVAVLVVLLLVFLF